MCFVLLGVLPSVFYLSGSARQSLGAIKVYALKVIEFGGESPLDGWERVEVEEVLDPAVAVSVGGIEQVAVVGVHHSGTSVIAKILLDMGYYGGKNNQFLRFKRTSPPVCVSVHLTLSLADEFKAYWEHLSFLYMNRETLKSVGQSDIGEYPVFWANLSAEHQSKFEKYANETILELNEHRPWMVKDPRLCLTLQLWLVFSLSVVIHSSE